LKNQDKLLILGGTGFIGYHIAKRAIKKGFSVTSVSKNFPKKERFLPKVNYIRANISKSYLIKKKIPKDFKYIINLAGYVDHSNKKETFISHYEGCKNLANYFLNEKIKLFIQIGSSMEYGKAKSPQKESVNCKPLSNYARAKFLATKYLLNLYKKNNFPVVIFRLYQIYGPKQDLNRFIPITIHSCKNDKEFSCSHGRQIRDFLYVDDLVDTFFLAFDNKKVLGKIVNIGSGKKITIRFIIKKIMNYYNLGKPKFNEIKLRKEEMMKVFPDLINAKKILKWRPKFSFKQGLKKTLNYYNAKKY
jgi:nucleoside-diphosphate-sugar epimerase